ncbi:MAG: Gfo/Idh/MocA family protein [Paracoccaceae bacterium]
MSRKFGIGIVGVGMAVRPHMLSLQELAGEIEVCGVYARTPAAREAFALESGFPAVDSIEALLSKPNLDAVFLLTPANARVEIVRQVAAAGKHILMEKPAGRTTADAEKIVKICDDAGVKLGVIFQYRFRAASLAMKGLLDSGKLGELASAFLVVPWWRGQGYYDEPGRGTMERDGGGVMITQAIHSMDLMLSLTGPVAEVAAIAGTTCLHKMETEDFIGAGLKFATGALGSLMATVNCFPGEQEYMVFNCTKGSAKLAGGVLDVNWNNGRREEFGEPANAGGGADPMDFPHDWHMAQILDFVDAVKTDRQPVSNGHSALNVHRLIDALLQSSAQGKHVIVASD